MNIDYCYSVGGVGFFFETAQPICGISPYDVFRISRQEFDCADEKHHYLFYNKSFALPEDARLLFSSDSVAIYETAQSYIHVNHCFDTESYDCTVVSSKHSPDAEVYFSDSGYEKTLTESALFRLCDMVSALLYSNAVIIHASYIICNGKAILFSAPSEGGKSTQAELWHKYQGAEIINGDRAVIKKEKDGWQVYSLPMCGSSGICKRKSAPLSAIVMVEKAETNQVEHLSTIKKLNYILPQLTFEKYKQHDFEKLTTLLDGIIADCPILCLKCKPDKGATQTLKGELDACEQRI